MKKQSGFTLIELVIVIVILGILAAFIVPRFGALDKQARIAVVKGMAGSLRGAAAVAHGMCLSNPTTGSSVCASPITMDGTSVALTNTGWPTAADAGITSAIQSTDGFTPTYSGTTATFTKSGASDGAKCKVTYDATNGSTTYVQADLDAGC
jgi:MSHA pilin protein MshA